MRNNPLLFSKFQVQTLQMGVLFLCMIWCDPLFAVEPHPRLLFNQSDIPALSAKLGNSTIGGQVGAAVGATLKGQRDEAAIQFMKDSFTSGNHHDPYPALIIYDTQYPYLTPSERSSLRTQFLDHAQPIYNDMVAGNHWMYRERSVNNWTYGYGGSPLQKVFFTGIIFPDDPRAQGFRDKGLELIRWILQGGPNNGMYNYITGNWDVQPTVVDAIDETMGSPNGYGVYGSYKLLELMHVIDLNMPSIDVLNWYGRMWHSEAKFWTYNLNFWEEYDFNRPNSHWNSYASYGGAHGHTRKSHLHYNSNQYLLYWAYRYNEPVFAWHYYANPSPTRHETKDYLTTWNTPQSSYGNFFNFLSWGEVAPQNPVSANWPLTEFWENAGIAIIRKSWAKNERVKADQGLPDEPTGKVWLHGGPAGSKFRFSIGGVYYDADQQEILTSGPWMCSGCSTAGAEWVNVQSKTQNGLLIDDVGHINHNNLALNRRRYAVTTRLGENTFLMDMRDQNRTDFHRYFDTTNFKVDWTRKVHFDREKDILWIKDVASTDDGQSHQFRFNWISPNPQARTGDNTVYDLPANYRMVIDSNRSLMGGVHTYGVDSHTSDLPDPTTHFSAVRVGADASSVRMFWALAQDEQAARDFLQKNRGVFITNVVSNRRADGIHISWQTDETSVGRIEYGLTRDLDQRVEETSATSPSHELVLAVSSDQHIFFKIIAADGHGDESINDNNGELFSTRGPQTLPPQAPANLRIE